MAIKGQSQGRIARLCGELYLGQGSASIGQRPAEDEPVGVVRQQADEAREFVGAFDARGRQLDAGDVDTVMRRIIARGATEAGAEIGDALAGRELRGFCQRIVGGEATIMILIVRQQLIRRDVIEIAARRRQLGADDVGGDGMALVEIDRGADGHHDGMADASHLVSSRASASEARDPYAAASR